MVFLDVPRPPGCLWAFRSFYQEVRGRVRRHPDLPRGQGDFGVYGVGGLDAGLGRVGGCPFNTHLGSGEVLCLRVPLFWWLERRSKRTPFEGRGSLKKDTPTTQKRGNSEGGRTPEGVQKGNEKETNRPVLESTISRQTHGNLRLGFELYNVRKP